MSGERPASVVVVGGLNMDIHLFGASRDRLSGILTAETYLAQPGGKGANQARAASRLGLTTSLVGRVGDDEFGASCVGAASDDGVDVRSVGVSSDTRTGFVVIELVSGHHVTRVFVPGANTLLSWTDVSAALAGEEGAEAVLVQAEVPGEVLVALGDWCSVNGVPLFLDPTPPSAVLPAVLGLAEVLTPDMDEAGGLVGRVVDGVDTARLAARELLILGAGRVVIKLGPDGALLAEAGSEQVLVPTLEVEVADETGGAMRSSRPSPPPAWMERNGVRPCASPTWRARWRSAIPGSTCRRGPRWSRPAAPAAEWPGDLPDDPQCFPRLGQDAGGTDRREDPMREPNDPEEHDDHGGLHRDVPALIGRRDMLRMMGGLSVAGLLAACGIGTDVTTTTGASGSGTSTTSGDSTTTTTAADTTASAGDEIPDETAGPYPADGSNGPNVLDDDGIVRSDLTSSFGGSSGTADGVPIAFELSVVDAATGAAVPGAVVYLWHCTAEGQYSIYEIEDENYLRGVQMADDAGRVAFTSIFPGCYAGRWPHAHFEVYESLEDATAGSNAVKTSQLALPQSDCEAVYADGRYGNSASNLGQLSLDTDNVFSDGWTDQLATVSAGGDGYTASLLVRV